MDILDKTLDKLEELFSEEDIQAKIKDLAQDINTDFGIVEPLYVICVLKGSTMFCVDLVKHLKMPVQMEFVRVSSYGHEQKSSGHVNAVDLTLPNLKGQNVIVVEDIIDTGLTAKFFVDYINLRHAPKKFSFVALLDKKCARTEEITIDYAGFEIDNKFVVGYGLDYNGYYRNLPYIGYFPA